MALRHHRQVRNREVRQRQSGHNGVRDEGEAMIAAISNGTLITILVVLAIICAVLFIVGRR
jgi:hypothetical protein